MKKVITLATCAVFALSSLVGVAQGDQKVAKKDETKKESSKKEVAHKKDETKKETSSKEMTPKKSETKKEEAPKK